jgi:uncharacterized protein
MEPLLKLLRRSPIHARVAPFVIFLVLTVCQGMFGEGGKFWFYIAKAFVGAWLVWQMRPLVSEMRWAWSWEAVAVGVAIFVVWVGLDGHYPRLADPGTGATPFEHFGAGAPLAWLYIVVHIACMTIVVPPIEEVFYRSFLYRLLVKMDFLEMPLNCFHGLSFVVTSTIFGVVHPDRWLAGILCGLAYQWLVVRKNRLGDAMTAHAITNFLLGVYIVWKGAWSFW